MLKLHVEEVKMSISDTAVSMAASWSLPCTPAGRNWVRYASEPASARIREMSHHVCLVKLRDYSWYINNSVHDPHLGTFESSAPVAATQ